MASSMQENMNMSEDELKKSYWYVTHAARIRQISFWLAWCVVAVIVLMATIPFGGYLYYAATREERIVKPLRAQVAYVHPTLSLQTLAIRETGAVSHGGATYDVYALIENQNSEWRADGEVFFMVGGSELAAVPITLFPGDRRYVFSFNVTSTTAPRISARVQNIVWKRLTLTERNVINARRDIRVSDVEVLGGRTAKGVVIPGTRAHMTLSNASAYHLYDFRMLILFKHGGVPVAAAMVPIFSLEHNTQTRLEARWDYSFASTDYEMIPEIDIVSDQHIRPAL